MKALAAGLVAVCVAGAAGGCGAQYHVRLTNDTDRTMYAGIMEVGPGVNQMHARATIGPGDESELSASREGDERSRMSVMVGESPNPRERAVVRSLEEGKNRFAIKSLAPGAAGAGITLEREEGGWW